MGKHCKGRGRKIEIGTKMYPDEINYIDIVAKHMGMTRYALIRYTLIRFLEIPERNIRIGQ